MSAPNLERIRKTILSVLSGDIISVADEYGDIRQRVGIDDVKALFERYELILNSPTNRKTIDFSQQIFIPEDEDLALVANRLKLVGLTHFSAMLKLCQTYSDTSLFDVFVPYVMRGHLPKEAKEKLARDGFGSLRGHELRPPLLLMKGEGGSGKSTLAKAVAIVLGITIETIAPQDITLYKLLGPEEDRLLKGLGRSLEDVFGILPVKTMHSQYIDIAFNFNNLDLDLFIPKPTGEYDHPYKPGQNPASRFQSLFDSDVVNIPLKSLGMMPVNTRGWLTFASTNKDWPNLDHNSNAYAEIMAFRTRIREVNMHVMNKDKQSRLHAVLDEIGIDSGHLVRFYIEKLLSVTKNMVVYGMQAGQFNLLLIFHTLIL